MINNNKYKKIIFRTITLNNVYQSIQNETSSQPNAYISKLICISLTE